MQELTNGLVTTKYTRIMHEEANEIVFNAPHHFEVYEASDRVAPTKLLCRVDFQKGPIKENGVNGIHNEDLIAMVLCRLEGFQQSPYACRENSLAITKLEEALLWLRARTMKREKRGVEGTSTV